MQFVSNILPFSHLLISWSFSLISKCILFPVPLLCTLVLYSPEISTWNCITFFFFSTKSQSIFISQTFNNFGINKSTPLYRQLFCTSSFLEWYLLFFIKPLCGHYGHLCFFSPTQNCCCHFCVSQHLFTLGSKLLLMCCFSSSIGVFPFRQSGSLFGWTLFFRTVVLPFR